MSNTKHTPGPWNFQNATPDECAAVETRAKPYATIAVMHHGDPMESSANARLIAAAPELLAALENLRDNFDYPPAAYQIIVDAIAKATGGDRE